MIIYCPLVRERTVHYPVESVSSLLIILGSRASRRNKKQWIVILTKNFVHALPLFAITFFKPGVINPFDDQP